MKISRFSLLVSRFLSADTATGGGTSQVAPAPVAPVAPVAPAEPDPEAPADPAAPAPTAPTAPAEPAEPAASAPKKLTIFDRAASFMQDRGTLVKQISDLTGSVSAHLATIAERDQTIVTLNAELSELRTGRDQLAATIAGLEKNQTTVANGVTSTLAEIGVPLDKLPAAEADTTAAKTMSRAEFDKLSTKKRNDFMKAGGTIEN
jgi:hypothetical protein